MLLLDNGTWIPGVRVESASFSLTLSALANAYTTAVALGRASEAVALALSRPCRPEEQVYVDGLSGSFTAVADDVWIRNEAADTLPSPTSPCTPTHPVSVENERDGVTAARRLADRAHVPLSAFPVGMLLETDNETYVPGVNVEHPDWARILCAERNAFGTVQSYALSPPQRGFLSCVHDATGTPCGACRQWMAELAPESILWMDRHDDAPERTTVSALLPGSFQGRALRSDS